jgi:hypothetical protein
MTTAEDSNMASSKFVETLFIFTPPEGCSIAGLEQDYATSSLTSGGRENFPLPVIKSALQSYQVEGSHPFSSSSGR